MSMVEITIPQQLLTRTKKAWGHNVP